MTGVPNAITLAVLVHHYFNFDRYPLQGNEAFLDYTYEWLLEHGLIEEAGTNNEYSTTARGNFLINHYKNTPLPNERTEFYIPETV